MPLDTLGTVQLEISFGLLVLQSLQVPTWIAVTQKLPKKMLYLLLDPQQVPREHTPSKHKNMGRNQSHG